MLEKKYSDKMGIKDQEPKYTQMSTDIRRDWLISPLRLTLGALLIRQTSFWSATKSRGDRQNESNVS